MNVAATIQARMGATRLPGKVLKQILGKPMLQYQVERIKQSLVIDDIIIATSASLSDDPIVEFAELNGIKCYRGSENDVLARVIDTLKHFSVDVHVEFMGDNPIPDPYLVDSIIGFYLKNKDKYDYVTNSLKTTFPPGFEVYVYPSNILYEAEKLVQDKTLREHVGIHIYNRPDKFRIFNIEAPEYVSQFKDYHFEVDTVEDFDVITSVIEHFFPVNPNFSMMQAIEYLNQHPDLVSKNVKVPRRWQKFREE